MKRGQCAEMTLDSLWRMESSGTSSMDHHDDSGRDDLRPPRITDLDLPSSYGFASMRDPQLSATSP